MPSSLYIVQHHALLIKIIIASWAVAVFRNRLISDIWLLVALQPLSSTSYLCKKPPSPREWWENGGVSTDPMVSGCQLCFQRPTEQQKGLWDVISKYGLKIIFPFCPHFSLSGSQPPNAVHLALASFLSIRPGDSVPQLGGNRGNSHRPLIKWGCVFCSPRLPVTLQPC